MPIYREGQTMNSQNETCGEYYVQLNHKPLKQPKQSEALERSDWLLPCLLIFVFTLLLLSILFSSKPLEASNNNQLDHDAKPLLNTREFLQHGTLKTVSYDNYIKNAAESGVKADNKQQRVWM